MEALDFDAETVQGAMNYFVQRNAQTRKSGWHLRRLSTLGQAIAWGVLARFDNFDSEWGEQRFAVYVLLQSRGSGRLSEFLTANSNMKFITMDDCNVENFYKARKRDILVLPTN